VQLIPNGELYLSIITTLKKSVRLQKSFHMQLIGLTSLFNILSLLVLAGEETWLHVYKLLTFFLVEFQDQ
jgi:hypothetical protein